jgi:hypothetical protein
MPSIDCPERLRLAAKVVQAVSTVYSLKEKKGDDSSSVLLFLARAELQRAERNLAEHIKEHNCLKG